MREVFPTAAKIYADDSFPTPDPTLRLKADWGNLDVSEGDELVMRKDVKERDRELLKRLIEASEMTGQHNTDLVLSDAITHLRKLYDLTSQEDYQKLCDEIRDNKTKVGDQQDD